MVRNNLKVVFGRFFTFRPASGGMPHSVLRHFEDPQSQLLGVPRERTVGERVRLEAAQLLVARKRLSLTGLAVALRQAATSNEPLEEVLISSGAAAPADYYAAVAQVYGLRFVDLRKEPIDASLAGPEEYADYVERNVLPWRRIDGQLLIAAAALSREHFEWGDSRFGPSGYDFVIAAPTDIQRETGRLTKGS